ncbi:MAG TPA: DinB family protein [Vicinamibacterales bacterium]|nr:DinB family protein [Vicinamibacterales bacterium]
MVEHDHHHDKHAVHLALVQRLRAQAADVRRLTKGLDEATLAARTVAGKWSLKELVCHFRRMETIFGDRFREMCADEHAVIVPYNDPDGDQVFVALTQRPTEAVLSEYLSEREALCRTLEAMSPAEWHRKATHPEFPHYDVHFQAEYMAHHEAHHIYQLFQRRVLNGKLPH